MFLLLPDKFAYHTNDRTRDYAYVKDKVLHIRGLPSWEKIAYDLTYALKGKKHCKYCGQKLRKSKATIDHMFPRNYGGISIPVNLLPSCNDCNNGKSDLNFYQYKIFHSMNKVDASRYRQKVYKQNERLRYKRGFILPKKWITTINISEIIARPAPADEQTQKKYKRVSAFLSKYHKLPNPIVISANNFLLEGNTVYWVALDHDFQHVPVIKLENVVVKL